MFTVYAAAGSLSASQIEGARLAGGEQCVLTQVGRYLAMPAVAAGMLAGILSISDPGPGLILGMKTGAAEILTSFSAMHDRALAGRQCLALAILACVVTIPVAWLAGPGLATQILVRQTRRLVRSHEPKLSALALMVLGVILILGLIVPATGFILPLFTRQGFARAWNDIQRTWLNTVLFGAGSATVAVVLGLLAAFLVGRSLRLRGLLIGSCLLLLAFPPSLPALGLAEIASASPASLDWLLRSRLTVSLALGLRVFPIAAVLGVRAWAAMPTSWAQAAALQGVPLWKYLGRVALPYLLPTLAVGFLLTGLLATADVTSVLLLHPAGEASLPLAIFTVMANAPEALVASLCLTYLGVAGCVLCAAVPAAGRWET
jgi:ABC-type Fe3+ transport system permease subunit